MPADDLKLLDQMVGSWTTRATHPAFDAVVHGTVDVEWLEGERFLIQRARNEHPDFPDSISILGFTERDRVGAAASGAPEPDLKLHYFDSRGVFRLYQASIGDGALRFWRNAPGLSQRYVGTFEDDGNTLVGRWQMCEDGVNWTDDLAITFRRRP
jgi:hypothetical protein